MATKSQHTAKRNSMGPLTCFAVSPDGVRFETQEEEEDVVLFLRPHLIVLLPQTIILGLLLLAPPFVFPFFQSALANLSITLPVSYSVVGMLFWYVATFGFALVSFLRWFFNIYIVTRRRIVDIDFVHLLYKEFSEARLDKIQDITYRSGGVFAAFFDYGDVHVQTAAEMPNLEFLSVPKPAQVVATISELIRNHKHAGGGV